MATTEREPCSDSLEDGQSAFRDWVATVRNPAREYSEGIRQLTVLNGAATADYEIALLPNGRWAISLHCIYRCGNCHGVGVPWSDFERREECLNFFLATARKHFGHRIANDVSSLQDRAQVDMANLLRGGLFGFMEPMASSGSEG